VQGNKLIGGLESEINKWQKSLGGKASVTHTSTAMTEHKDEAEGGQTRLATRVLRPMQEIDRPLRIPGY
jgi:hypothetical protein